jgi:catechol 2,3-dioxygenase-like lactoylglutathione lyase family enzyme
MKIDHFALSVSSIEDSVKWYKKVLGASVKQRDKEKEAILEVGKLEISLIKDDDIVSPRHIAFDVNNVNTASLLEIFNIEKVESEMKSISSSYVYITDPDGNTIQLGAYGSLDIE